MLNRKEWKEPEDVLDGDDSDSGLDENELEALIAADESDDSSDDESIEDESEDSEEEEEVEIDDLKTALGNTSNTPGASPAPIELDVPAADISCHPQQDLIASVNLDGELLMYVTI